MMVEFAGLTRRGYCGNVGWTTHLAIINVIGRVWQSWTLPKASLRASLDTAGLWRVLRARRLSALQRALRKARA